MTTQWKIQIDWDRDGDYTTAIDDITDWVIKAKWELGINQPYQDVANNPRLEISLDNADKRFSPENASSPLYGKVRPQVPMRVVSNDGTTERVMWVGWLHEIKPMPGRYGDRRMVIIAKGAVMLYRATETQIELQEDKRTDEIVNLLVNEVVYPPKLAGVTLLGIPGNMELGINTQLGDPSGAVALEAGKLTLGYAADNWVRQGGYTNQTQDGYDVYRGILR